MSLLEGNAKENFKQLFEVLSDEDNYPVILSSNYGKGFNDIASLFILVSLGVNRHEISEDYTWANKYFCHTRIIQKISHLPEEVREAIVSIIHNNQRDLSNVMNTLQNQHESIDKYLIDSLNLSLDIRRKIHNILLVDEDEI
jgi:protein-tyrosine phosphatase